MMIKFPSIISLAVAGLFGIITVASQASEESTIYHEASLTKEVKVVGADGPLPESISALVSQGLKFHGTFDAPGDIQGYALSFDREPVSVYVPPTAEYAIIGTLIDAQGNDVMENTVHSIVLGPILEAAWSSFESTRFIAEGSDNASHIMYTLTDPNCPYCNALWKSTRPLIKQGELQLRHVLVGVLSEDSIRKAAAILESSDPARALEAHELNFDNGGIEPVDPSKESWALLSHHGQLMRETGATGTPTSFYRDNEGNVQRIAGALSTSQLRKILGIE